MDNKNERKKLVSEYKNNLKEAGVYKIINKKTGDFILGSSMDIQGVINKIEFGKKVGSPGILPLKLLAQVERDGLENFELEIVQVLETRPETDYKEAKEELAVLEQICKEELGCFE